MANPRPSYIRGPGFIRRLFGHQRLQGVPEPFDFVADDRADDRKE